MNSKYNTQVYHVFNETRYRGNVTLEEYTESAIKEFQRTKNWADETNKQSEEIRRTNIQHFLKANKKDVRYAYEKDGVLHVDRNLYNVDIMNFRIVNEDYKTRVNMAMRYQEKGMNVDGIDYGAFPSDKLKANPKSKIKFEEVFKEYVLLRKEDEQLKFKLGNKDERIESLEISRPYLKPAYEKLGVSKVKQLQYNVTNIKRELVKIDNIPNPSKIKELISIEHHHGYSAAELKQELQKCYDELGIKKRASASQLLKMGIFDFKKETIKKDGKSADVYTIIRETMIY